MQVVVSNIEYDGDDGDIQGLPTSIIIEVPNNLDKDDYSEYISDRISDITGVCHYGFTTNLD